MTLGNVAHAGLKKEFDIALSKKLCPPRKNHLNNVFEKRIVTSVDNIIIQDENEVSYQPRENINVLSNVNDLTPSFRYKGWLHDQKPLVCTTSKSVKGKFVLRRGFNRYETVTNRLGWKFIIIDVYKESANVRDNILFAYQDNNGNLPSAPNKDIDFVKGAVQFIDETNVDQSDDKAIIAFLEEIVKDEDGIPMRTQDEIVNYLPLMDEEGHQIGKVVNKGCLLYKVRLKRGRVKTLRPLDGTGANALLHSLNLPWAGDKGIQSVDNSTMDLGYAYNGNPNPHRILWDGLKYYRKYQKPVFLFGYVQNPSSTTLESDRRTCYEHYKGFIQECELRFSNTLDTSDLTKFLEWKFDEIFPWGGFIPQDESINKDGNKTESGLVKYIWPVAGGKPMEVNNLDEFLLEAKASIEEDYRLNGV